MGKHPAGRDKLNWNKQSGLVERLYHIGILSVKPRKEKILKIHIETRRGKFEFEREPMEKYKFYTMWGCITACVVVVTFFSIF